MVEERGPRHTAQHHHHDHESDEEEDRYDSENQAVRRPSMDDGSFLRTNHGNATLHHRRHHNDESRSKSMSPTPTHNGNGASRRRQFPPPKQKRRWGKMYFWLVLTLVFGYLFLAFIGYFLLHRHNRRIFPPLTSRSSFLEPNGQLYAMRERLEQKRLDERNEMSSHFASRASQRAHRTTPPRRAAEPMVKFEVDMLIDRTPTPPTNEGADSQARMQDLCGEHAQEAAGSKRGSFPTRSVLNSKARVLITGILNPVGFHLALALKERCGVEVIGGIDPVFPNTVAHRLALQKRIQILSTNIPKLVQPVMQPLVGLDPRPSKSRKTNLTEVSATGEMSLLDMRPTHIVHLASYSADEYKDFGGEEFRNLQSPYVRAGETPEMFVIRSSHIAMEQILASMKPASPETQPHFIYASSATTHDVTHDSNKLVDEVLADLYGSLHKTYSVGLRLPSTIYGPWGRSSTPVYDLNRASIEQLRGNGTLTVTQTHRKRDFVYVDDAVAGIIAAMQYREPNQRSTILDFSSDSEASLEAVGDYITQLLHPQKKKSTATVPVFPKEPSQVALKTRQSLHWAPTTPLSIGLQRTLAWHLDDAFPYGDRVDQKVVVETGDQFRTRYGIDTCSPDDLLCHVGPAYLPCLSECSTKDQCTPSIFEGVASLVLESTEGCDIVLYTQSLGYDVRDIKLQATYKEDVGIMVCNFAFVPESSRLVSAVIKKVPESQLKSFGVKRSAKDSKDPEAFKKRKLEGLNGRLLYRGWILIWVKDAHVPLPPRDMTVLKLSPGKLFSPEVHHALFVDENFPVSPNRDDVLFLVGQTHRPALPERNAYRKIASGKKIKYRLTAEPERRAAVLMSPLKYKRFLDTGEPAKLSVYEATKYMQVENGENPEAKEPAGLKKQREFYERVQTFVNRLDFRSNNEAWYRYELKSWIRTRWIVHNLKLEEARQLRCDWYQEHVQWNNTLDQLSFAHVMTVREIERKIAFQEPDDHVRPAWADKPELLHLSDGHEWSALESEENRMAFENIPSTTVTIVANHMVDKDEKGPEDGLVHNVRVPNSQKNDVPLFVRIVSERVMLRARQVWAEVHHGLSKK